MNNDSIKFGILTVSDSCSSGLAEDTSGTNLENLVKNSAVIPNGSVTSHNTVPDEVDKIKAALIAMAECCEVILTTGGTGFSARDVTPEATKQVIDREAPGLTIAMFKASLDVTPFAMLSRAVCGIRNKTLIINLPGSKKGSQECFESIAMTISHAVSLLQNHQVSVEKVHSELHMESSNLKLGHNRSCQHQIQDVNSKVDVSKVARRPRESPYPLISVPEAVSIILSHSAISGTETVDYMQSLGRIIVDDVYAKDPLPPFPASIKDGYAVVAGDGKGPRVVLGVSVAGTKPLEQLAVHPGACMRINTGAPVPPGADAVVQVEDTSVLKEEDEGRTEKEIDILQDPKVGQDIRPLGSDILKGQLVLRRGSLVGSCDVGLMATVGVTKVLVYRLPAVAILSTGNELQDPDLPLGVGCIRDSNKATLLALLREHGYEALDAGIATDSPQVMLGKLKSALTLADVLVSTGSVSMGDRDILKQVLTVDLGATIHFGRVHMKPGKPTTFATCEFEGRKKLIFGLPGNPASATVTCHLFVLPSLRKTAGYSEPNNTVITATVTKDVELDTRPEYHRAVLSWSPGTPVPTATSTGNQISSRLLSLSSANCLLAFPARSTEKPRLQVGTSIDAILLTRPLLPIGISNVC